jgi:hypothetical protein
MEKSSMRILNRLTGLLLFAGIGLLAQTANFLELTGPYLGQIPPAGKPALFAPGIVSFGGNHSSVAISPDGNEFYWSGKERKIWCSRSANGRWTKPEIASFCQSDDYQYDNPFITPDGKKLFVTSFRPGAVSTEKETIWYTERTPSGWSALEPVSPVLNETPLHWSISVSDSGTLYFQFQDATGKSSGGIGDIYFSRLVDGAYTKPETIGPAINTPATETCPHIAPDESYVVFTRFDSNNVLNSGIFISYRDRSGRWLPPVMAEGGTKEKGGLSPRISPDRKYLFYVNGGMWWMPAGFIETLKPKELR